MPRRQPVRRSCVPDWRGLCRFVGLLVGLSVGLSVCWFACRVVVCHSVSILVDLFCFYMPVFFVVLPVDLFLCLTVS